MTPGAWLTRLRPQGVLFPGPWMVGAAGKMLRINPVLSSGVSGATLVGSVLWAVGYTDLARFTFLDQQDRAVSTEMAINDTAINAI